RSPVLRRPVLGREAVEMSLAPVPPPGLVATPGRRDGDHRKQHGLEGLDQLGPAAHVLAVLMPDGVGDLWGRHGLGHEASFAEAPSLVFIQSGLCRVYSPAPG